MVSPIRKPNPEKILKHMQKWKIPEIEKKKMEFNQEMDDARKKWDKERSAIEEEIEEHRRLP